MIARMSGLRNSLLMTQQDSHRLPSHIHVPRESLEPYTLSVTLYGPLKCRRFPRALLESKAPSILQSLNWNIF